MEFKIIPEEQTPWINEIAFSNIVDYINLHRTELNEFLKFAQTQDTAVGLAANQCSLDGERFMVRVFALRDLRTNKFSLVIDPHIKKEIGISEIKSEGCLTWHNRKILAKRFRAVDVSYFTMDGKYVETEMHKGFEGQIWQHETNHLNGIEENVVSLNTPDPVPIRLERNQLCPCGSGLKYKKCCLLLI